MVDRLDIALWARNNPTIFALRWRALERAELTRRVVRRGDDAVIEGFPRSANTYATYAFIHAQKRPLKLGNHFHSPAQLLLAAKYGVPAMLVLRNPVDAVLSLVLYEEGLSPNQAFRRYVGFHKPLSVVREHFVVALFEDVITDFNRPIRALNDKFGTSFELMGDGHSEEVGQLIAAERARKISSVQGFKRHVLQATMPSKEKELAKRLMTDEVNHPKYASISQAATEIYRQLLANGNS